MRSRGVMITLVALLLLLFAAINWSSLAVSLPLNLIVVQIQAPLGLVLVAFSLGLCFVFLLASLLRRAGQLRQLTRLENELERERARVEKKRLAEFEGLEARLDGRFGTLETTVERTVQRLMTEQYSRLEAGERAQAERLEAHVLNIRNELASDLEQIETSIRRSLPPPRTPENDPG